jgi:hypothetical protein
MSYLAIFKRIIPFFLTFAAGLLIASIFVPVTAPSFRNADRGGKWRHHRECKKEKESLRRENMRLRQEIETIQRNEIQNLKLDFELDVPPPPPPPRVVR